MKKRFQSLSFLCAVVVFLSVGISLNAQQTPQTQPPDAQAQQPTSAQPPQAQPSQAPDQTPNQTPNQAGQQAPDSQAPAPSQSAQSADSQSFTGTIVKSGDKYVFQDAATGNTYDIDHQEELQKYEGKKVKVHGVLDASGKMIHVQ
jgi:cytoskeletal protein RodZ